MAADIPNFEEKTVALLQDLIELIDELSDCFTKCPEVKRHISVVRERIHSVVQEVKN